MVAFPTTITSTVCLTISLAIEPVGNGLVASLAKPGGNITGIATQSDEVLGKLVEILHEVAPGARRIAFLLNEASPSYSAYWFAAQSVCAALQLDAQRIIASAPAQLDAAVAEIVRQRSQGVVVAADPLYLNERAHLEALPTVSSPSHLCDAGAACRAALERRRRCRQSPGPGHSRP